MLAIAKQSYRRLRLNALLNNLLLTLEELMVRGLYLMSNITISRDDATDILNLLQILM